MPDFPYIHLVPKGFKENLAFRRKMLHMANEGPQQAADLWRMCARDALFYFNAFLYTADPRPSACSAVLPFITYPFQDKLIAEVIESIATGKPLVITKSRTQGATWTILGVFQHHFTFLPMKSFLAVSRNEDYVDKTGNMKALFQKIDFIHEHLPKFLNPIQNADTDRFQMHMLNRANGSVIDGEATTGDVGRGDRRTAILIDEFSACAVSDGYRLMASTQQTSPCRIYNFTPQGTGNAAYDLTTYPNVKKVYLHWSDHPEQAKGLYCFRGGYAGSKFLEEKKQAFLLKGIPFGDVTLLDGQYKWEPDYPFILDGKLRSPWYDQQCEELPIPSIIAAELDLNFAGSGSQFFDQAVLDAHLKYVRTPTLEGELDYDSTTCYPTGFLSRDKGRLKLWADLDVRGEWPRDDNFVLGIDVSSGTGASNSACSALNDRTGEKILEYENPNIRPEAFAEFCVSLARWLNNAFMIWDMGGPGRQFGARVMELDYRSVFMKQSETTVSKTISDTPGFYIGAGTKKALFGPYQQALGKGEFINRSANALAQCAQYVHDGNDCEHVGGKNTLDPSGARANHGDVCVADSLAFRGRKERNGPTNEASSVGVPYNSFMWRRQERKRLAKKSHSRWKE